MLRRSAEQHVVEVHSLRRMSDAHATTFALPAQRGITRRRVARVVAVGENDHTPGHRRADREFAGLRLRAPPKPDGRSLAWRQGRSRCLRRPSRHRRLAQVAQRRHGRGRASSSEDRPALCRNHRGQGRCGGSPSGASSTRVSPAQPSPARCRPKDASAQYDSGASPVEADKVHARRDKSRPACRRAASQLPDGERGFGALGIGMIWPRRGQLIRTCVPRWKASLLPNVIFANDWVITCEAMNNKATGRACVQLDAERPILCAVTRTWNQNLTSPHLSASGPGDFFER